MIVKVAVIELLKSLLGVLYGVLQRLVEQHHTFELVGSRAELDREGGCWRC